MNNELSLTTGHRICECKGLGYPMAALFGPLAFSIVSFPMNISSFVNLTFWRVGQKRQEVQWVSVAQKIWIIIEHNATTEKCKISLSLHDKNLSCPPVLAISFVFSSDLTDDYI